MDVSIAHMGRGEMLIAAAVLLIVSIAGLIAAVIIGTPAPGYPRHGTFGVDGFDSSFVAWACVGLCAVGLLLLFIDSKREKSEPAAGDDQTPRDDLFGQTEVQRELGGEERVVNRDMLRSDVPSEEATENL